jgi:hypothetical protein
MSSGVPGSMSAHGTTGDALGRNGRQRCVSSDVDCLLLALVEAVAMDWIIAHWVSLAGLVILGWTADRLAECLITILPRSPR